MIKFKKGYKYQNVDVYERLLKTKIKVNFTYRDKFLSISEGGYLAIGTGYAWNGADCFPDFDWIKEGSMVHDALLQLVELGVIPESENHAIDKELGEVIKDCGVLPRFMPVWLAKGLIKTRAGYVTLATHLATTRKGDGNPIIQLPRPK